MRSAVVACNVPLGADCMTTGIYPGKADGSMMMHEPGNLPYSWYRNMTICLKEIEGSVDSGSRVIDRTEKQFAVGVMTVNSWQIL